MRQMFLKLTMAIFAALFLSLLFGLSPYISLCGVMAIGLCLKPVKGALNSLIVPQFGEIASKSFSMTRMPRTRRGYACYKEEGDEAALIAKIKTHVENQLQNRATKDEARAIAEEAIKHLKDLDVAQLRSLLPSKDKDGKEVKGVIEMIAEQGLKISEIEKRTNAQPDHDSPKTIRQYVKDYQTRNAEIIKRIKDGENLSLPNLEMRVVASPMLTSTVNSGNSNFIGRVEVEAGINDIPAFPNTFWDSLTKGRTNAATYVWVNKSNRQGAAAFIGPGVAKPGISFELVADNSNAKKIADSAKASTELLDDIDGMTTFIQEELRFQVFTKVNATLMDSTGSSTVPEGVKQLSQAFSFYTSAAAGLSTTNPTYMDAIRAVVAALRSGKLLGDITVYINPIDAANMDMSKASDSGVYLLPPFVTSDARTIAGARIIEDPNLPVGDIQAGFMRYYRVLIYRDFVVSWGWENDDFTKNLVTAVGEMRIHQFFNDQYTGAFLRDSFATIIAAITAA